MHPPSAQVLRALRSSLSQAPCRPTARQTMPRASLQPHSQNLRCLSVTPTCSRTDDRNSRKSISPQKPPTKPPRRFDLSTADLKAGLRDRREAAAREAAQAAVGSSSSQNRSRNVPRDRGESTEGVDERSTTTGGTDLSSFDVFADVAAPTTAVDACLDDGFHLNNGVKIGNGDGCLLVDGEVFRWRPWEAGGNDGVGLVNAQGQWEAPEEAWGLLKLVWPKPDLLIIGVGATVRPISPETRRHINELGIRTEVLDTRNAAAQFNLLATERGLQDVAGALIPMGRKE